MADFKKFAKPGSKEFRYYLSQYYRKKRSAPDGGEVPAPEYNITLAAKIIPVGEETNSLQFGSSVNANDDFLLSTGTYTTSGVANFAYIIDLNNEVVVDIPPLDTSSSWGLNIPSALDCFNSHALMSNTSENEVEVHSYDTINGTSAYVCKIPSPTGSKDFAKHSGIRSDCFGNNFISDFDALDSNGAKGTIWKANWNGIDYSLTELVRGDIAPGTQYGIILAINNNSKIETERLYTVSSIYDGPLVCIDTINNTHIETFPVQVPSNAQDERRHLLAYYDNYVIISRGEVGVEVIYFDGVSHSSVQVIDKPAESSEYWGMTGNIYEDLLIIGDHSNQEFHAYKLNPGSGVFEFLITIQTPEPLDADQFCSDIDINEKYIYIGAKLDDEAHSNAGAVYVYNKY